jgi:hypothetical protein
MKTQEIKMIYATYYICQEIRTLNVYEAVQAGELREAPVFMDVYSDNPVLQGRHVYEDGGWTYVGPPPKRPTPVDPTSGSVPPECAKDCKWRQTFSFDRQRNALRCEAANMVEAYRCGWNLKPGVLGGHALDYAACTYRGQA